MTTVMKNKKKNHRKKPKLDNELVRAMAEPPRKIYQDARRKAAALRRAQKRAPKRFFHTVVKKPRHLPGTKRRGRPPTRAVPSLSTDQGGRGCIGSPTDLSPTTDGQWDSAPQDGPSHSDGSTVTQGPATTSTDSPRSDLPVSSDL